MLKIHFLDITPKGCQGTGLETCILDKYSSSDIGDPCTIVWIKNTYLYIWYVCQNLFHSTSDGMVQKICVFKTKTAEDIIEEAALEH